MVPQVALRPHSPEWYDRLARLQRGYWYPWRSTLSSGNGEELYLEFVQQHLQPNIDVLDVACGQGELSLDIAVKTRTVLGYDRQPIYIELARRLAECRQVDNVTFVCADSSLEANGGRARIPALDTSFDLLLCRRGPHHWVEDAYRVARPGATLIMLIPNLTPRTEWSGALPDPLGWNDEDDPLWARDRIAARMAATGLSIDRYWACVVPEYFSTPEEFYKWRAWGYVAGEVPPFIEVQDLLHKLFQRYAGADGLEVKHSRFIWMTRVPG